MSGTRNGTWREVGSSQVEGLEVMQTLEMAETLSNGTSWVHSWECDGTSHSYGCVHEPERGLLVDDMMSGGNDLSRGTSGSGNGVGWSLELGL